MFDPTIYENIKVVLEGEIYDIDLSGQIEVTKRRDLIDLAQMSRKFIIQFKLVNSIKENYAEIHLLAKTEDLAYEILETSHNENPGCAITIKFFTNVKNEDECEEILNILNKIWDYRPKVSQRLTYPYEKVKSKNRKLVNEINLNFGRKIDEDNIDDIHNLVGHTLKSLNSLSD